MLVFLFVFNIYSANCYSFLPTNLGISDRNIALGTCVSKILNNHVFKELEITFVDMDSDGDLLPAIANKVTFSFLSREPRKKMLVYNNNYLIHAANISILVEKFKYLTEEERWNPRARCLIVLDDIEGDLREVFNQLLNYHVLNTLVVDGSIDMNLFTYEPFENFGCGKRYDRIVDYGKCLQPNVDNLFPYKLGTGLWNCTVNIEAAVWPPFVLQSPENNHFGIEQIIFYMFSKYGGFNVNYSYVQDPENFYLSKVENNTPLESLHNNKVDVTIGGMLLLSSRTGVYDYIFNHFPYIDQLSIIVKKSKEVDIGKCLYIEFPFSVWILVLSSFVIFFLLMIVGLNIKDKTSFILMMYYTLLGHGVIVKLPKTWSAKFLLIQWLGFAFLITVHYQSRLTSVAMHPLKGHQIGNKRDLKTYKVKACVSTSIRNLLNAESSYKLLSYENYTVGKCEKLLQSIDTISNTYEAFTICYESVCNYYTNASQMNANLYRFRKPWSKILYGMFFYKGFPLLDKFNMLSLRLRENGLVDKFAELVYWSKHFRIKPKSDEIPRTFGIPWFADYLIYGVIAAIVTFVVELVVGHYYKKSVGVSNSALPLRVTG